jgi:predicted nucleic acid-binding protein
LRHHPGSTNRECADAVTELLNLGVLIHEPDASLADKAASLAYKEGITFYDATYLALAQSLGTKLLTADRDLIDKLSQENRSSTQALDECS